MNETPSLDECGQGALQRSGMADGDESTFSETDRNTMLDLARVGIGDLVGMQRAVIG